LTSSILQRSSVRNMDASARVREAGFEPLEPYPGNNRTFWRCRHSICGNEIQLKLGGIVSGKNPCKYCNGQWVDPQKAIEVMLQAGLEPMEPYVSSKHRWKCRCLICDRTVTPQYNSVLVQGSGCRFCGKSRGSEKRRVPEREAIQVMREAGYEPLAPYVNSQTHWNSIHVVCGREVSPTYGQIRGGNGGCKHCAGVYVDPVEAIEVMRSAGYEPQEPYVNSGHQWKCLCLTCGKETTPTYGEARTGSRCKYCANKAISPEDAVEVMRRGGFEPLEPYPGSMNPWMCRHNECGEILSPRYAHVQQGRRACQRCSKKYQAEILSLDPEEAVVVMRNAGLEPLEPYPGNNKPWRCRHIECGREVKPRRAAIQQGQGGCKPCHQQRLAKLYRTPDDVAMAEMLAAGFEPVVPYPGRTHEQWKCRCTKCDRNVDPTLSNVKNGATCIYCSGKRLDVLEVESLMRRAGLEPLEPYPGRSSEDWKCKHLSCGREVVTRYSLVRDGNSGCIFCNGGRIHADDATLFMRERGLEPLEPFPGTSSKWKCQHLKCGRTVTPTYSNVTQGGGGCKACSDSTFAYDAPGIIYLMKNENHHSIKVGITTEKARTDRIRDHERGGWTLVARWNTPTGFDAEIIENAILKWWRTEIGAPYSVRREDMPSGGFTETAALIHVDIEVTKQRIEHYLLVLGDTASSQ
jgi:hypothetical protein